MSRKQLMLEAVKRGKYAPLFHHLMNLQDDSWAPSFGDIEGILRFRLPNSARIYRPWWANDTGSGHSQSMAWSLAGWKAAQVDLDAEALVFLKVVCDEKENAMQVQEVTDRQLAPSMDDFRATLKGEFAKASARGLSSLIVRAGDLHRIVGGYPTPFNRMPMCCNAMYEAQNAGDRTVAKPPKDFGATLTIEYRLPR